MAVFLASDGARFVNGQNIAVDGAITTGRPWSTVISERQAMAEELTRRETSDGLA